MRRRGSFPQTLIEDPCAYEVIRHDDGPIILSIRNYEHSLSDSTRRYHLAGYQIGEFVESYKLTPVHWWQWLRGRSHAQGLVERVTSRDEIEVELHSAIGNKITLGMLAILEKQKEYERNKLSDLKKEIFELEQSANLVCDAIYRIESRINFLDGRRTPGVEIEKRITRHSRPMRCG